MSSPYELVQELPRCIRRSHVILMLGLSGYAGWTASSTQADTPRIVTLQEVIREARSRAPAVLAALATLERAEAELALSEAEYWPHLRAEGVSAAAYSNHRVLPNAPRVISNSLQQQVSATAEWQVVELARGDRSDEAQALRRAQVEATASTQRDVMRNAAELYVRALASAKLVDDARLTVARREGQLRTITALANAGMQPAHDAHRAQLEVIQAQLSLRLVSASTGAALAALAGAMGREPTQPVVPEAVDDQVFASPVEPREAVRLALIHRSELRELEHVVTARSAAHSGSLDARFPSFGVVASGAVTHLTPITNDDYSLSGAQYDAYAGIYLRWDGLDPSTWQRANLTESDTVVAKRALFVKAHEIKVAVVEDAWTVQGALAQRELVAQLLAGAKVGQATQESRYRAGLASLLELLDAEEFEQRARRSLIEAERDERLSRIRLLASCGLVERLLR